MARIWNKHKQTNTPLKRKVFVGLSGGVDSSVAAKLLLDEGHDVVGAFIKIWQPEFLECTWEADRLAAKRTAAALGIPFLEVDLSDEYKRLVIDDMIAGYRTGVTPNPDVLCNESIKFGAFRAWAKSRGADKIATGHYAHIRTTNGRFELLRGADPAKDQSYFLYRLTQDMLADSLFPIGHLSKKEVRAIAAKAGLPSATRPDSQGLCFVGTIDIGEFISRFIPLAPGDVLDEAGRVIGTHRGSARYTIGARHGFEIMGKSEGVPHYVVAIDTARNTITVSVQPRAEATAIELVRSNWISETGEGPYGVSLRYHQEPQRARLTRDADHELLTFEKPQQASPGQSAVVYAGERCLGGGIVYKAH